MIVSIYGICVKSLGLTTLIVFDSGTINDAGIAKDMLDSLLASLRGQRWAKEKHPWVKAHDTVWARVKATSSETVSERFKAAVERYFQYFLKQVRLLQSDMQPGLIPFR
jgi:hypothetical protein